MGLPDELQRWDASHCVCHSYPVADPFVYPFVNPLPVRL